MRQKRPSLPSPALLPALTFLAGSSPDSNRALARAGQGPICRRTPPGGRTPHQLGAHPHPTPPHLQSAEAPCGTQQSSRVSPSCQLRARPATLATPSASCTSTCREHVRARREPNCVAPAPASDWLYSLPVSRYDIAVDLVTEERTPSEEVVRVDPAVTEQSEAGSVVVLAGAYSVLSVLRWNAPRDGPRQGVLEGSRLRAHSGLLIRLAPRH